MSIHVRALPRCPMQDNNRTENEIYNIVIMISVIFNLSVDI